jgi:hypothetical protein
MHSHLYLGLYLLNDVCLLGYTDPSIGSHKETAQHHQRWEYNTSTRQLMLSAAADMECTLENGIDYVNGDIHMVGARGVEDCCAACEANPNCKHFSYDTQAVFRNSSDPSLKKCWLKSTLDCPTCTKTPNQIRVSGTIPNATDVPKCLSAVITEDGTSRYIYETFRKPCLDIPLKYTPAPTPVNNARQEQQWDFRKMQIGSSDPAVYAKVIRNRRYRTCLSVSLNTKDWRRTGQADLDESQALISVQHQPDSCLACVSSSGEAGQTCGVGDVPKITRCNGALDGSRLTWAYQTNTSATSDVQAGHQQEMSNITVDTPVNPSFVSLMNSRAGLARLMKLKSFQSKKTAGECVPGFNIYNYNLPLATNPFRNVSEPICRSLCAFHPGCKAYVFVKQGCEKTDLNPTGTATPDCFLKSIDGPNIASQACSCMGTTTLPPPMCATTQLPSAGSGRDSLPDGETCSEQSRTSCCLKYDNGADPTWSGQPCIPALTGTFKWSTANPAAVCAPQSWVIKNAPKQEGSCGGSAGSFAFPCRSLVDKHSGLCLTGATFRSGLSMQQWREESGGGLSMQQCDPTSEMQRWIHDPVSSQIVLRLVPSPRRSTGESTIALSSSTLHGLSDFSESDRKQQPLSETVFNSTLFHASVAATAAPGTLRDASDMHCVQVYIGPPVYPTPAPGAPTPVPAGPTPASPTPAGYPTPGAPVSWPTPAPPPPSTSSGAKKSSAGAVAGGAIGALAFSAVAFVALKHYRGDLMPGTWSPGIRSGFAPLQPGTWNTGQSDFSQPFVVDQGAQEMGAVKTLGAASL